MTSTEHMEWAKKRALVYVDRGELRDAVASMISDLGKHPDTECPAFLGVAGMLASADGDADFVRHWIEGFN